MSDEPYILLLPPHVLRPTISLIVTNGYVPIAPAFDEASGETIVNLLNELHKKKDDDLRTRILTAVTDAIEGEFD